MANSGRPPAVKPRGRVVGGAVSSKKAGPRTVHVDPARLAAARRALGTSNAAATVDVALDYVVFGRELRAGTAALGRIAFDAFDRDDA